MGYKQADLWVVELNEDQWYGKPQDAQEQIRFAARADARNHECRLIAVFVTPDPLFPMCGEEKRHRVYHHDLNAERQREKGFKVSLVVTSELDTEKYESGNAVTRKKMLDAARDAANEAANGTPGRYVIQYTSTARGLVVLERGRV